MTRIQLQIDVSPELRSQLRILALQNNFPSMRALVLHALWDKYPALAELMRSELTRG